MSAEIAISPTRVAVKPGPAAARPWAGLPQAAVERAQLAALVISTLTAPGDRGLARTKLAMPHAQPGHAFKTTKILNRFSTKPLAPAPALAARVSFPPPKNKQEAIIPAPSLNPPAYSVVSTSEGMALL
jgi:hypothetical protein